MEHLTMRGLRRIITRFALTGIVAKDEPDIINVFIVPSVTVNLTGVYYIFSSLNTCQNIFNFVITKPLEVNRTQGIKYSNIDYSNTVLRRTANIELNSYISQLDFYPQIDSFLSREYKKDEYIKNESLAIFVGREKFIWDDPSETYNLSGDFNEDGYTILYNNDDYNDPSIISEYNNIAAISITKLTAIPDIDFEMARSGPNIFINAKTYVVSNVVHFLADRLFSETIAWEHFAICILRLDWTGGLYTSLASRKFCDACKAKMYKVGTAFRAHKSFSCDDIIANLESMASCLDRIDKIKNVGDKFKVGAFTIFSLFGMALLVNVLANYSSDTNFNALVEKYSIPIEISAISILVGIFLLIIYLVCKVITPGKGIEI